MRSILVWGLVTILIVSCGSKSDDVVRQDDRKPAATLEHQEEKEKPFLPLTKKVMEDFYYKRSGNCLDGIKDFALVKRFEPKEVDYYTIQQNEALLFLHNDQTYELVFRKRYFLKSAFDIDNSPKGKVVSEYGVGGNWELNEGKLILLDTGVAKNISWKEKKKLNISLEKPLDSEFSQTEFILSYEELVKEAHYESKECNQENSDHQELVNHE